MNEPQKSSAVQDIKVADGPGRAVGTEFPLYKTEGDQASAKERGERDAAA